MRRPHVRLAPWLAGCLLAAGLPAYGLSAPIHARAATVGGTYHALAPARILDTRASHSTLGAGGSLNLAVAGQGGVPSANVTAVVMNVTVADTTAASYLTVYPTGGSRPLTSNLNWVAGATVPNLVTVGLGGGDVTVYNGFGSADVIIDVEGYFLTPAASVTTDGLYNPIVPVRVKDTRGGTKLGAGQTLVVPVAGVGTNGVPATGAEAAVLNVTVTDTTAASYLTVWPTGTPMPLASNLNFVAAQTVPNRVMVGLGTSGAVSIYNGFGSVDVVVDANGWFTDGVHTTTGSTFTPVTPARILDSRNGTGGYFQPWGPQSGWPVAVAGQGGVPLMTDANPPTAVIANVTVTDTTSASALTAWPDGASLPLASDLNWTAGVTVPNLAVVQVGATGDIDLQNYFGCTDAIVDVVGWFTGPAPSITAGSPPVNSPCPIAGKGWLSRLNYWRATAGLPPVVESTQITDGYTWSYGDYLHSEYMIKTQTICHCESTSSAYYTAAGDYASQNSNIEVSSTTATTDDQAIDWWMAAPFHAMAMVDPRLQSAGYGAYRQSGLGTWESGFSLNVGSGGTNATGMYAKPTYWPGNNETVPLRTYSGNEFPDPEAACGYTGTLGLPVFVEIGGNIATDVTTSSFKGNGTALTACVLDSAHYSSLAPYLTWRGGVIVVPQAPLQTGVVYSVTLTINGLPYAWSFQVT